MSGINGLEGQAAQFGQSKSNGLNNPDNLDFAGIFGEVLAEEFSEDFEGGATQRSNMTFSADCYANRSYGDGTNGLFALGFHYDVMGDEDATMNLVWNFGVESEMTDWGTLRLGYKSMYDAGGGANTAGALKGGLGFNYESFELDMNVDVPSLVHDPVVYMSGRNAAPLGAAWTVTYSW